MEEIEIILSFCSKSNKKCSNTQTFSTLFLAFWLKKTFYVIYKARKLEKSFRLNSLWII